VRHAIMKATLAGLSTITFGRMLQSDKNQGESAEAHDKRCWRERMTTNESGEVCIHKLAPKLAMEVAAKFRSDSIPGKGKQTFTKNIRTGLVPSPNCDFTVNDANGDPILAENVIGRTISVPSDGRRGGSKRVPRKFPEIDPAWSIDIEMLVFDQDLIEHNERLHEYLELAGIQIGFGSHRPETSGGDHGMFEVQSFELVEAGDA